MRKGIVLTLPKNPKKAVSVRELGEILDIPQTSMYKFFKSLQQWENIGIVKKLRHDRFGHREKFFYIKKDFKIIFKGKKLTFEYIET